MRSIIHARCIFNYCKNCFVYKMVKSAQYIKIEQYIGLQVEQSTNLLKIGFSLLCSVLPGIFNNYSTCIYL